MEFPGIHTIPTQCCWSSSEALNWNDSIYSDDWKLEKVVSSFVSVFQLEIWKFNSIHGSNRAIILCRSSRPLDYLIAHLLRRSLHSLHCCLDLSVEWERGKSLPIKQSQQRCWLSTRAVEIVLMQFAINIFTTQNYTAMRAAKDEIRNNGIWSSQ